MTRLADTSFPAPVIDPNNFEVILDDDTEAAIRAADAAELEAIERHSFPRGSAALAHRIAAIDVRRCVAHSDEEHAALDAETAFEAARFETWAAESAEPVDASLLADADAAETCARMAWLVADKIAREFTNWLRDRDAGIGNNEATSTREDCGAEQANQGAQEEEVATPNLSITIGDASFDTLRGGE